MKHALPAFTLLELILVMAILALVGIPSILTIGNISAKNLTNNAGRKFADVLQTARISSRESRPINVSGNLTPAVWGVTGEVASYRLLAKIILGPDPVTQSTYALENGLGFDEDFGVWFEAGTGNLQAGSKEQVQIISLAYPEVKNSINISDTGVIEVRTK